MQNIKKYFMTLALLITAVTGAWADNAVPYTVGATDNSGVYRSQNSNTLAIKDGQVATFEFTNYTSGEQLWQNWICEIDNAANQDQALIRADLWENVADSRDNFTYYNYLDMVANDAATFKAKMQGAKVRLLAIYYNGKITIEAWMTPTSGDPLVMVYEKAYTEAQAKILLTIEKCHLDITKEEVRYYVPLTATENKTNEWTINKMPAGNVDLDVIYYPQAAFATGGAPTAINDVPATTDGAIVKEGTVANIPNIAELLAQGQVMYYVSQTAKTDAELLALAADAWTADVPTAEKLAEGTAYVYYYIKGNDSQLDDEIFSDGDIKAANGFEVTLAAAPTYKVEFAEGTPETDKWKADPNPAKKGQTVTVTYSGDRKVKSVKAVKKKAEPAAIINGKFSVSATKQVYFSKGNLRYASGAWSFFDNQYDYYATYSADAWDKFGWSNSTNNFGMSTSTKNAVYQGDLVDWGTVPGIGTGWFTLSNNEWGYLFNTRSASTVNSVADARYAKGKVNNVYGIILFPDTYTHPAGVTLPVGINEVGNAGWNGNNYSAADWTAMETAGCVFLPATGYREGTSVSGAGSSCSYRSSSRVTTTTDMVNYVYFAEGSLTVSASNYGRYGQCVRLVQDVK